MALTDPQVSTVQANRRTAIADAAILIIARDGLRSLTHRAIDRELDLPAGSTSYYARTRRQLIAAVVHRLAERTTQDLATTATPQGSNEDTPEAAREAPQSVDAMSSSLAALVEKLALRSHDQLARYALAVDLTDDQDLHDLVTSASPVRRQMLSAAQSLLEQLHADDPPGSAPDLIALVDGLLFDRLAGSGRDPSQRADATAVLRAYLTGLPRTARVEASCAPRG